MFLFCTSKLGQMKNSAQFISFSLDSFKCAICSCLTLRNTGNFLGGTLTCTLLASYIVSRSCNRSPGAARSPMNSPCVLLPAPETPNYSAGFTLCGKADKVHEGREREKKKRPFSRNVFLVLRMGILWIPMIDYGEK